MNTFGKIIALAALGLTALTTAAAASSESKPAAPPPGPTALPRGPNVLIVGEDADKDTLPRFNRNFNRILRAVAERFIRHGFKVYDETALTMDILPQGGVRRELPELLETARYAGQKMGSPIDVVVVFQVYPSVRKLQAVRGYKPFVRIAGRMIKVRSGQDLGGYEFGPDIEFPILPESCVNGDPPNECLHESFGNEARLIADAVGDTLADKLAAYLTPADLAGPAIAGPGPAGGPVCDGMNGENYVIRFRDFDGPELNRVEEAFVSFACYQHHRVLRSQPGLTEYAYETRADQSRLTRNMRMVLDYMNLPGTVSVTGNTVIVEKHLLAPPGVIAVPPGAR
jgi:hypothetical protein